MRYYHRSSDASPGHLLCLVAACFLLAGCAEASQQAAAPTRTPAHQQAEEARTRLEASEGGQLVLRTIEAHGGLEAWYSAPTSAYSWEYSNVGSNMRFKSYLVADNNTRQVYHDLLTLGTPDNAEPVEGRFAWDGTNAWISPDTLRQPNPRFWATTGYYFESIPFVLADPGVRYERLPEQNLDDVSHDMVKVTYDDGVGDSPGDAYTLYVNKESGLVDAIRYTVTYGRNRPEPGQPVRESLFYYQDYVTVDGLTVATRFRGFRFVDGVKGDFRNEAWASDISFRQPFDAAKLQMPEDGRIQPMPERSE